MWFQPDAKATICLQGHRLVSRAAQRMWRPCITAMHVLMLCGHPCSAVQAGYFSPSSNSMLSHS